MLAPAAVAPASVLAPAAVAPVPAAGAPVPMSARAAGSPDDTGALLAELLLPDDLMKMVDGSVEHLAVPEGSEWITW